MDRLRRTFSLPWRKKENKSTNSTNQSTKRDEKLSKISQRRDDERAVRSGVCNFQVKYLGHVEVQDSRGINLCEQAIQALLNQKSKHAKAMLHITGDSLRVIDRVDKILLVDQTIEKVSFCSHDRHYEKGFAYICRDGTTRRWLCHGFLSHKIPGERLSHAVGCAFQICLEKKRKYQRENFAEKENFFNFQFSSTFDSFRTLSIEERKVDPQSAILTIPIRSSLTDVQKIESMMNERPRPKTISTIDFNSNKNISIFSSSYSTPKNNLSSFDEEISHDSTNEENSNDGKTNFFQSVSFFKQSLDSDSSNDNNSFHSHSSMGLSHSVPEHSSYFDAWNSNLVSFAEDDQCIQSFSFDDCSPIGESLPTSPFN